MLREILVPGQNDKNFLKLYAGDSPCCGDGATRCQQVASYAAANSLTAITVKDRSGNNKTLTFTSVTGAANVLAALRNAIYSQGYEEGEPSQFEGITVVPVSNDLRVIITGDLEVVSLTHSGGTANFDNRRCNQVNRCSFVISEYPGGTTNTIRINGVNYAVGTMTPGVTNTATIKSSIEGHLAAAGVGGTATVVDSGSSYNITIAGVKSDSTLALNGTHLMRSACAPVFE